MTLQMLHDPMTDAQLAQILVDCARHGLSLEKDHLGQWFKRHEVIAACRAVERLVGQRMLEPVVYGMFDAHGFYTTKATEALAKRLCEGFNQRDDDPLRPYTHKPLYALPTPRA